MIKSDLLIKLQPLDQITQLRREFKIWHTSQVATEIRFCPSGMFSTQLDAPMDAGHLAQLLVYVQYIRNENIKTECSENLERANTCF
jgi:hypothetical protein